MKIECDIEYLVYLLNQIEFYQKLAEQYRQIQEKAQLDHPRDAWEEKWIEACKNGWKLDAGEC